MEKETAIAILGQAAAGVMTFGEEFKEACLMAKQVLVRQRDVIKIMPDHTAAWLIIRDIEQNRNYHFTEGARVTIHPEGSGKPYTFFLNEPVTFYTIPPTYYRRRPLWDRIKAVFTNPNELEVC